jgi:transglutaminase-like putative cysteine protease
MHYTIPFLMIGVIIMGFSSEKKFPKEELHKEITTGISPDTNKFVYNESPENKVTAEIAAGIEKHIENETIKGKGYFKFVSGNKEFKFKLVRIHKEYLAKLEEKKYFACVDLVDTLGDVYDVDFFLAGSSHNMTVTETSLHKLNGIPFYVWKQNENGTWERAPLEGAPPELLGVIHNKDEFDFLYRVTLPTINGTARIWLPFPQTDQFQTVQLKNINSPKNYKVVNDKQYNNKIFFFELGSEDSGKKIEILYHVQRKEKSSYSDSDTDLTQYLKSDMLTPVNEEFKKEAEKVISGKKTTLTQARALYDYVMDRMKYMKYGPGWGKADAIYACHAGSGNCSDYHAYFISLARSVGIPARFAIGASIPSERNDGGIDGYHCWAEFYAEGKWWPVDISEADKYSALATYYFGHHPANRFELSRGRDLVIENGITPQSGPINFLAYPVLEINGEIAKAGVEFSFRRY